MHETETYKKAMIEDLKKLGYTPEAVLSQIRDKGATHLWNPSYEIRDDAGDMLSARIRDVMTGKHIHLKKYKRPLAEYLEFKEGKGMLINESQDGWELDMPFNSLEELTRLVDLFLRKYGKRSPEPWPEAYRIPVLLIGEYAMRYAD